MRARATTLRLTHRWVLVAAITVGVVALVLHFRWPTGLVGQTTYLVWTGGGALVALHFSRRFTGDAARPWRWVALSQVFSALGDAYYAVHSELLPPIPDTSLADVGWL